ncbi:MAG: type II toxin-antitoxin system death-on-curing family toxin [Alphaproteobacteria bacterium]|nr:type II toxin-antitoxin system death-on-curing family toxin [Alphaproteobacteria bacterium]
MRDFLTVVDVLAIHANQIDRFGGAPGLRDAGILEAALFRPQTGYYADVVEEAAALWESLSQGHPFIDGNKRTALAAMHVFLTINGIELQAAPRETYDFIAGLYETAGFRFPALVEWLRRNTRPLT